jgi:hypothetical protein
MQITVCAFPQVAGRRPSAQADQSRADEKIGPNTILIREWGGNRHEVTVLENGAMFLGKHYRFTLSSGPHH